jgi:hypothetical protein
MAILATLFAAAGRFLGRVLNMALGWATIMLFGRVPESKQLLLSGITLGSLAWVVAIVGVLVPDAGAFLLAAVPRPDFIPEWSIRLGMLIAALVIPLLIGIGGLFLLEPSRRPGGTALVTQVLRGYPYAFVLAFSLAFLAIVAPVRKVRSMLRRWSDAHIPVVTKPGGYERVARDLEAALDQAGLDVDRRRASRVLEVPAHLLGWAAGAGVRSLMPDRLTALGSSRLEVLVYPSDISIAGKKQEMARARACIASRLTFTAAYLTSSKEGQQVEDRLEVIARAIREGRAASTSLASEIDAVQETLASLEINYEEWEVLYRLRLQVERDLLKAREAAARGERVPATATANGRSAEPSVTERAVETAVGAGFAVAGSVLDRILAAGPLSRLPGAATRRRAVERQSGDPVQAGTSLGGGRATEAHP